MAVLSINECLFRIHDGRKATLAIGAGNANVTYTLKSKHEGSMARIKVAHVTAGLNTALSVVVTSVEDVKTITVNLATDGGGVATSTALAVKNAVVASGPASALVVATNSGTGGSLAIAAAAAAVDTTPARSITFKVGSGTLNWSEPKEIEYDLDAGKLDTTKEGDEQPVTLDTSFKWEEFTASTGSGVPSVVDALNQLGEASTWVSTSDDPQGCSPYCVDIEITRTPTCAGQKKEVWVFEEFYWDDLNPNFKDGTVSFKGLCNRTRPNYYRI